MNMEKGRTWIAVTFDPRVFNGGLTFQKEQDRSVDSGLKTVTVLVEHDAFGPTGVKEPLSGPYKCSDVGVRAETET